MASSRRRERSGSVFEIVSAADPPMTSSADLQRCARETSASSPGVVGDSTALPAAKTMLLLETRSETCAWQSFASSAASTPIAIFKVYLSSTAASIVDLISAASLGVGATPWTAIEVPSSDKVPLVSRDNAGSRPQ